MLQTLCNSNWIIKRRLVNPQYLVILVKNEKKNGQDRDVLKLSTKEKNIALGIFRQATQTGISDDFTLFT